MRQKFFPRNEHSDPKIYAYITPGVTENNGYIKIGYTIRDADIRIKEQTQTVGAHYKILLTEPAIRPDGSTFTDKDIHRVLAKKFSRKNEWFKCSLDDVKAALIAVRSMTYNIEGRTKDFKLRPEQQAAIDKTKNYFLHTKNNRRRPKFLWNAKMRFGKTFAVYELCRSMGFTKILVLTFKPVVESAWSEDLLTHINFEGWQFISNHSSQDKGLTFDENFSCADKSRPVVVFGSFQDLLGKNKNGGIKAKNQFIHESDWDIIIFDEYHYGAWRDNAKKLFNDDDEQDFDALYNQEDIDESYDESFLPIKAGHYLYLSGTPFRALNSGEFIEEQIYSWTYSDEQRAKESWHGKNNPYESLPRVVMMAYKIPDEINKIAAEGEFNEFDLNKFFAVKDGAKRLEDSEFVNADSVQKWLNLIRGSYLMAGKNKFPPMPFSDVRLLQNLNHTLWFLPDVASCYAMYNLLTRDNFFRDYRVILCAGTKAGVGLEALDFTRSKMGNPYETKSITLSCGKLTTGVTVPAWSGVFMLRNLQSPETYFQTAFRVQSPFTVYDEDGSDKTHIIKRECYIFDFALNRALKQVADYSCRLNIDEGSPEKKVSEFIKFLPVLAYDGSSMNPINAQDVLDIYISGTSATLLARRWQSPLLVNVDDETLKRLFNNPDAMRALENIEAFRNLNKEIAAIINQSEHVKCTKNSDNPANKRELTQEEKEIREKRKMIRDKLIKFNTRIPIFMYLTDLREESLKDVITQLDSKLFHKVTGLNVSDFDLLCSLGVFNSQLMDEAIYNFKCYEDKSLTYTGLNQHENEHKLGLFDKQVDEEIFYNQIYELNSTVNHKKNGHGVITDFNNGCYKVKFDSGDIQICGEADLMKINVS